jgi:hypothetical protein
MPLIHKTTRKSVANQQSAHKTMLHIYSQKKKFTKKNRGEDKEEGKEHGDSIDEIISLSITLYCSKPDTDRPYKHVYNIYIYISCV